MRFLEMIQRWHNGGHRFVECHYPNLGPPAAVDLTNRKWRVPDAWTSQDLVLTSE